MKDYIIPEHRSDQVKKVNLAICARCGDLMLSRSRKKFCAACSDLNAEERRRANYLAKKVQK